MKTLANIKVAFLILSVCWGAIAEEKGRLNASDLNPGASDTFFFSNAAGADTQCDEVNGTDCCDGTLEETYAGVTRFTTNYCKGRYNGKSSATRYGIRLDTFHAFRSILNENQIVVVNSNAGCTGGDCCPTSGSTTYNWLLFRARPFDAYSGPMDMSLDTTYVGGTVTYNHSQTVKWSGSSKFSLNKLDSDAQTNSDAYGARLFGTSTCSGGEFKASAVTDFTAANRPLGNYGYWFFGKNIAVYRQVSADPLLAVAFPRPATSLTASGKMAEKNKQVFTGVYTGFTTRGVQVQRNLMMIPDAAGTTFTLSEVSDPSNPFSVSSIGTLACTNLDQPSQGFCRGTLSLTAVPGQTGKATCMVAYDINNRDLVFCSAQNPTADSNHRKAMVTIAAVSASKSVLTASATPVHLDSNTSSGQICTTVQNLTSRAVSTISITQNLSGDFSSASLSGTVPTPFSGIVGSVPACGTSMPAFSKCQVCSNATLSSQKVSAAAIELTYDDAPSSTKAVQETAVVTRGVSSLAYEKTAVTKNKTPSLKAIFGNGTYQNIDAIKDKLQCSGTCTSETGSRTLAYTIEGLSNVAASDTLTISTEEEICYNNDDDDSDGNTDCFDVDCNNERGDVTNASLLCNYNSEVNCTDSFDNDKDGDVDCADGDCSSSCSEGNCLDLVDDNGNGLVDCSDADCSVYCSTNSCNDTTVDSSVCNRSGTCLNATGCDCGVYNALAYGGTCTVSCTYDVDGDGVGSGCNVGAEDCDDSRSGYTTDCSNNKVLHLVDTTDISASNHLFSISGSAQSTSSPAKFGGTSLYVPSGNNSAVYTSASTDFNFGSGNFTVEFWLKGNGEPEACGRVIQLTDGDNYTGLSVGDDCLGTRTLQAVVWRNGLSWAADKISLGNWDDSQWHHFALVRSGNTLRSFRDGVQQSSATFTGALADSDTRVVVGGNALEGPSRSLNVYLDDLIIIKGHDKYTGNFTIETCADRGEYDTGTDGSCTATDNNVEDCDDGIDNDSDGYADCADFDNYPGTYCNSSGGATPPCEYQTETNCSDGLDNDGDGDIDMIDTNCQESNCADYVDNNNNGLTDCADSFCSGAQVNYYWSSNSNNWVTSTCQSGSESYCDDGYDNDGDGFTDTADTMDCPITEVCTDGTDNDSNGAIDCADTACYGAYGPHAGFCDYGTETNCSDGVDGDGDGFADSPDPDCVAATENCTDSVDNDSDGQVDCADLDCNGIYTGMITCESSGETSCTDSYDNDGDGLIDCADSNCSAYDNDSDGTCNSSDTETCNDGIDNNGNWSTDENCSETSCGDGTDNDSDMAIDCADSDCFGQFSNVYVTCEYGTETSCTDGYDNDGDGLADSSDTDCPMSEVCNDGTDNDSDGYIDCADSVDCMNSWVSTYWDSSTYQWTNSSCETGSETYCNDGYDNDGDGLTDLSDTLDCSSCTDSDSDTYGASCAAGTDCDDTNSDLTTDCTFTGLIGSNFYVNGTDVGDYDAGTNTVTMTGTPSSFTYDAGAKNFNFAGYNITSGSTLTTTGTVTFNGGYNSGTITGTVEFLNSGSVQDIWEQGSNRGIVNGSATFNYYAPNQGTVTGDAVFNTVANMGTVTGHATFNSGANNWTGGVVGTATFNDDSFNDYEGQVLGDATFNDLSYNSNASGGVGGNATFNGDSWNQGTVSGNAVFNNYTLNYGGTVIGHCSFFGSAYPTGTCGYTNEACYSYADDDGDGLVDCADPDCAGQYDGNGTLCESTETTCGDWMDNDGDSLADCQDEDCGCVSFEGGSMYLQGTYIGTDDGTTVTITVNPPVNFYYNAGSRNVILFGVQFGEYSKITTTGTITVLSGLNYGQLVAPVVTFNNGARNEYSGSVTTSPGSPAIFRNDTPAFEGQLTMNQGTITYDADFFSGAANYQGGNVLGHANFYSGSSNSDAIAGSATFHAGSSHYNSYDMGYKDWAGPCTFLPGSSGSCPSENWELWLQQQGY